MTEKSAAAATVPPFEQKGYDAWVEIWCDNGYRPTAGQCPARYLQGEPRSDFIRGWVRAESDSKDPLRRS